VQYALLAGFVGLDFARRRLPAWLGPLIFLLLSLAAVHGALRELWLNPGDDYFSMGGLVTYSDASGYLRGARALIEFGHIDVWAARRVFAVLHYATLLFFSGQNVQLTVWLVAMLCALALWLATSEVLSRCGFAGAYLFWLFLESLLEKSAGRVMTEPLGFLFGTLAFVFILRGLDERDRRQSLIGLLLLQLSQSARPGALFILPLLAVYYLIHFREDRLRFAAMIAGTTLFGFLLTSFLQHALAAGPGQANFAYTLYGLARGGIGWRGVLREHPDLLQLTEAARAESVSKLAMAALRESPLRFVSTVFSSLWSQMRTPFAFFYNLGLPFPYELYFLPALLGLFALRRHFLFLLPCLVGALISSPFLADAGSRAYITTLFAPAALAAAGMGLAVQSASIDVKITRPISFALAGLLGAITLLAPFAFLIPRSHPAPADGQMQIRVRPGSGVVVATAPAIGELTFAEIAVCPGLRDIRAGGHLRPGMYLTSALDRTRPEDDRPLYFVFDHQPPFGDLTVKTTLLEAGPFGHSLYAAEVVAK
jgi:hypothetical protein